MTSKKEEASKNGQTAPCMKVTTEMARKRGKESSSGLMEQFTMANGRITRCTEQDTLSGRTGDLTRGSTKTIRNTVMELLSGQTAGNMKETGSKESKMEKESTLTMRAHNTESGSWARN